MSWSRDSRPDCKQVTIGWIVTREGYALGYELFEGNRVDVTTVEEVVEKIESLYGKASRKPRRLSASKRAISRSGRSGIRAPSE